MTCCFVEAWKLVFHKKEQKKSEIRSQIFRLIFRHEREKQQNGRQISIDCIEQLNNLYLSRDNLLIVVVIRRRRRHQNRCCTHGRHLKWTHHCSREILWKMTTGVKTFYWRTSEFVWERRLNSSACLLSTWWYIFQVVCFTSGFLINVVSFP